jgi:hypothetical protein
VPGEIGIEPFDQLVGAGRRMSSRGGTTSAYCGCWRAADQHRAVGYEVDGPTKAIVQAEKTTTTDIKLKQTKNLASQLTNAEW